MLPQTIRNVFIPGKGLETETQEFLFLDVAGEAMDMQLPTALPSWPSYLSDLLQVDADAVTDRCVNISCA